MALDDLLKGLAVFQDGIKQYAASTAINDANEQLTALNQQQMDRNQALQAHSQVAQNLAMRLGAAGADAAHINALTSEIAPSQGAQYQAQVNQDLQSDSQSFKAGEAQKDRNLQVQLQQMKLDALDPKNQEKLSKYKVSRMDAFSKDKQNQEMLGAFTKIQEMRDLIKNSDGSQLGTNLAQTGLIRAMGDTRISNEDLKRADNDPSARAALARRMKLEMTGKELESKTAFYTKLLGHMETRLRSQLNAKIDGEAAALEDAYPGIGGQTFADSLRKKYPQLMEPAAQQMADKKQADQARATRIQQYEAWLASPAGKDPKNSTKREAVLKNIARLKNPNQGQ